MAAAPDTTPFPRTVRGVVRLAKEPGVRHIVGLSCSTVDEEEAVVRASPAMTGGTCM